MDRTRYLDGRRGVISFCRPHCDWQPFCCKRARFAAATSAECKLLHRFIGLPDLHHHRPCCSICAAGCSQRALVTGYRQRSVCSVGLTATMGGTAGRTRVQDRERRPKHDELDLANASRKSGDCVPSSSRHENSSPRHRRVRFCFTNISRTVLTRTAAPTIRKHLWRAENTASTSMSSWNTTERRS